MPERRYDEDEIAQIFGRASRAEDAARRQNPPGEGLTLGELQAIGREVGIAPEHVAEAAYALAPAGRRTTSRFFGLPIGVGRTVELRRRLTDEEWERVVVLLRETFDARGRVSAQGSFREWTNGNLQALLEPSEDGHRLRLRTVNGQSRTLMSMGSLLILGSSVLGATLGLGGPKSPAGLVAVAVSGLTFFLIGAVRLPAWSRLRRRQMDDIASQLQSG
jgi:hypothetical protein